MGHYCGDDLPHPRTITTTKDVLLVRFLSDYSVAANGFRLEWVIQGCGGVLRKVQTVSPIDTIFRLGKRTQNISQ